MEGEREGGRHGGRQGGREEKGERQAGREGKEGCRYMYKDKQRCTTSTLTLLW